MNKQTKIIAPDKALNGEALDRDKSKTVRLSEEESNEIMDAICASLDLQAISIRLPKSLIEDFKIIAGHRNIGYQPLMRQILQKFASSELRLITRELLEEKEKAKQRDKKYKNYG